VDSVNACAVVIPCYNESQCIGVLVGEVRRHLPTVIVVDDGSTDGTGQLAAAAGARVVAHERNSGKGAALKKGLSTAASLGFEYGLTMDGDGQHRPEDIPALLECAERTGAALVVGNRMQNAQEIPWLRRAVNRWMSRRISRTAGRPLPDTQCGFRLVQLECYSKQTLRTDHFEIESEILLEFVRAGRRVEFIPIRTVGRSHRSKIRPVADTWRWLRWWRSVRKARV
jgi:glycosyltransferase involved in cell wall biosynthesis